MAKNLVIVESPAKAKTLQRYLGRDFAIKASVGHVKDLPPTKMGVDVDRGFQPEYVVIRGKTKVLNEIKAAAKKAQTIFLAPDPDREGEAIAWHIAEELRRAKANGAVKRVRFNEITKRAVLQAIEHPLEIDQKKFESQQARRILDRLVGYELSPLLWKKVRRGLSAGRVQSVAVRLVVERERAVEAFVPVEYWTIDALVETLAAPPATVKAALHRVDGGKPKLGDGQAAQAVVAETRAAGERDALRVTAVEKKERQRRPAPPYITSRLQQEAAARYRFTADRTMRAAQRLYEGVELGEEGPVALITYMRTDSTRLSQDALAMVRDHIAQRYGKEFVPDKPNFFRSRKGAQEAHEAIRPTAMEYPPERAKAVLPRDEFLVYELIWKRFVACQMRPAVFDATTVDIEAGPRLVYRATGSTLKFPGFLSVYHEELDDWSAEEPNGDDARPAGNAAAVKGGLGGDGAAGQEEDRQAGHTVEEKLLPALETGDALKLMDVLSEQHFTKPPPRYTDGTLVKELEEQGIGRPSTYASIMSVIQDKEYVKKDGGGRFKPTELGTIVTDLLVQAFPDILNVEFTARMEEDLDEVEEGAVDWHVLLKDFWKPFKQDLARAEEQMRNIKREEIPTEHSCEKCGKQMVIKWGRMGRFLACSGYPDCRNTKEFVREADGSVRIVEDLPTEEKCGACGAPMVIKRGRFGRFLACTRYPECKTARPFPTGVKCPREGCGGDLVERRSKRGRPFYGCGRYPDCNVVFWDRPVAKPCPQCGAPFLLRRWSQARKTAYLSCADKACGFRRDIEEEEGAADR